MKYLDKMKCGKCKRVLLSVSGKVRTETLLLVVYLQLGILLYFNTNIKADVLSDIKQVLITSTSIFSAIVIGMLLNGTSNHLNIMNRYKTEVEELSSQLTTFRRFIYYLVLSEDIWGRKIYFDFLRKLRDLYPKVNIAVSQYKMNEDNPIYSITADERYEYRTTRLFLSFLTIADIKEYEHMALVSPSAEFKYTLDKLRYMYEAFNNIWYYLEHKRASVDFSESTFNHIFDEDFSKQLRILYGDGVSLSEFNQKILVDKANEFYHEVIPKLMDKIQSIQRGVPKLLKYLLIELIFILVFGLLIPMVTYLVENFNIIDLLKASIILVISVFGLIIYHLFSYIYFESKKY